uniref:Pectinesterase inhibitor domain-containing protein n=1 Tax=Quercus lobata TaxID=97700 RepID=A0A7N2LH06_QUELO
MASCNILKLCLLLSAISLSRTWALNSSSYRKYSQNSSSIDSICKTTPYPDVCFDSVKLSIIINISIEISPNINTFLLYTLQIAIFESEQLSNLLLDAGNSDMYNIIENQTGTIQDCEELQQITMSCLQRSVSLIQDDAPIKQRKLADAIAYLSAALTNKNTCLEGLDSAAGPLLPTLLSSIDYTYMYVSNALSILSSQKSHNKRRLMDMGVPTWISKKSKSRTRILESEYDPIITAQSRDSPDEDTGISIQNCSIVAEEDLQPNSIRVKSYLGRPRGEYSRTVYLESYIANFIDLTGWKQGSNNDDEVSKTLYYGEYDNDGPGSSTDGRVSWPGHQIMDTKNAYNFTVSEFINNGDEWLDLTSFPYHDGFKL